MQELNTYGFDCFIGNAVMPKETIPVSVDFKEKGFIRLYPLRQIPTYLHDLIIKEKTVLLTESPGTVIIDLPKPPTPLDRIMMLFGTSPDLKSKESEVLFKPFEYQAIGELKKYMREISLQEISQILFFISLNKKLTS